MRKPMIPAKRDAGKLIRKYFEEETRMVHVTPPPSTRTGETPPGNLRKRLSELATAAAVAAAVVLLLLSAGRPSPLSQRLEAVLSTSNLSVDIVAFIEKASDVYRSESNGG